MLKTMRTSIESWTMKVLLSALILSFISFYGWSAGRGCVAQQEAAEVNGTTISYTDVEQRFQAFVTQYRRLGLIRDDITPDIMSAIKMNVVMMMINQELKTEAADQLGMVPSETAVRDIIKAQFSDSQGNFDFEYYKKLLERHLRKTPGAYEKQQGDALLAQSFDNLLQETGHITTEELRQTYALRNEKVNLEYIEIDPATFKKAAVAAPSSSEVENYFKQHASEYKIPEKRKLEVAWVSLADLAEPTEADLENTMKAEFPKADDPAAKGERIRAAHILLKSDEKNVDEKRMLADKLYERLKKGAKFETLAQEESEDVSRTQGGDLGYFGKGSMVKEFEQTAFGLKVGEISKPVKSQFGFHIIKLLDRIPPGELTVSRLKKELIYQFKETSVGPQKEAALVTQAQKLLNEAKEKGKSADTHIKTATTDFVSTGDKVANIPDDAQVIRSAETLTKGASTEPFRSYLSKNYYLVRVLDVKPSSTPTLDAVRSRVVEDVLKAAHTTAVQTYVKNLIQKAIDGKKSLGQLAKTEGLTTSETGDFTLSTGQRIPKIGGGENFVSKAFSLTEKSPILSEPLQSSGKFYVVALKKRTPVDWSAFEKEQNNLRKIAEEDQSRQRVSEVTEALRAKAKIKNNFNKANPQQQQQIPNDDG